jgi:hypothetical protein
MISLMKFKKDVGVIPSNAAPTTKPIIVIVVGLRLRSDLYTTTYSEYMICM